MRRLSLRPILRTAIRATTWTAAMTVAAAATATLALAPRPAVAATAPPSQLSREARWLAEYLRIDTTNPPGNEAAAAAWIGARLDEAGVPYRLLVSPAGRVSLYARVGPPGSPADGDIVLLHHMDVVAAGPGWSMPPFGGKVRDGRLYGRGAIDCKALGVAHLAAFLDAARRPETLERGVVLLAVAGEETGGLEGAGHVLERHGALFGRAALVLNEGGGSRVVAGKPLWWSIEVAQKRPLWLEIEANAAGGHAAALRPGSAVHLLVRALARLVERPMRYRVSPIVREVLRRQAALQNDFARPVYERIDDHVTPDGPPVGSRGWPPGLAALLADTAQVTVLQGAPQINVIATRAVARVDVRLLPDTSADAFLAEMRQTLGDQVDVRVLLAEPPSDPSPLDHPLWRRVERVLARRATVVPTLASGFTDSRFFRRLGIPAYGFSPFLLGGDDGPGIHGADESIALAVLDDGVETMRRAVEALVQPDPSADPGAR